MLLVLIEGLRVRVLPAETLPDKNRTNLGSIAIQGDARKNA